MNSHEVSTRPPSPILACERIAKRYGGVTALRSVDLVIEPGQIVGLVGANGAGKSTLIDIISGATPPSEGALKFLGAPLTGDATSRVRTGMARTFQMPQVAHELTLRENIACGLAARSMTNFSRLIASGLGSVIGRQPNFAVVDQVAEQLGLQDLHRAAGRASFGELRLTEVARALVQRPRFVMLDEPFPGVGDDGIAGVLNALQHMKSLGHAVLLVDHNVDVVASAVDKLAFLAEGEILLQGDVETCMTSPEFRKRYIGVV